MPSPLKTCFLGSNSNKKTSTTSNPIKGLTQAVNLDDFLGVNKRMTKETRGIRPLGQKGLSENKMISQVGFKVKTPKN